MPTIFIKKINILFLIADYFIINILCIYLSFHYFENEVDSLRNIHYFYSILMINALWFLSSGYSSIYKGLMERDSTAHFRNITKAILLFGLSSFIFYRAFFFNFHHLKIFFKFFLTFILSVSIYFYLVRILMFTLRKKLRKRISKSINTVLIGKNNFTDFILSNPEISESMGIKGYYTIDESEDEHYYIGNLDLLFDDLISKKIDNIVLCDDGIDENTCNEIILIANKKMIRTYLIPDFKHLSYNVNSLNMQHGIPIIKSMPEPLDNYENQLIKRMFDILFSSFVIIFILSWLTPIIALLIKIESRGPVFFTQERSGLKNQTFHCLKFRSMRLNKEAHRKMATKNDDRVTKIGSFLRKTSLDELPQFINVFIGNMSVVGPRPHMVEQTKKYSKILDQYMVRHFIKPGITGWAQVMGARGEIYTDEDMHNRIEKDIWYIQNWSLFLDFKIIFLTVVNVIKGDKQAY